MDYRNVLTLALVAVVLLPVASAYAPSSNSAPVEGEPAAAVDGGVSDASVQSSEDSNYTRLYITDSYLSSTVKPGESTTFDITVGNSEDHEVELNPHIELPQIQGRPVEESWVSIEDADTTLGPDEERTFTVSVSVPEAAAFGNYRGAVAFTNQTVSYPGTPERPVHSAQISVSVREEPAVTVSGDRYSSAQIQAGNSYTYEYTVENGGDEAVPLNPTIETRERVRPETNAVERSWFEIDAPAEVGAGESVTVSVTVTPPADVSLGRYDAEVDLGLQDPNRPDRSDYWQQVNLHFQVWEQPEESFEKSFSVSEEANDIALSLTAGNYGEMATDEPVDFEVTFVSPDGTEIDAERVSVTDSGSISMSGNDRRDGQQQGVYTDHTGATEFEYRLDDPEAGEWTVEIMPENTINFQYEIVRNED
jgi:hypothetical protein